MEALVSNSFNINGNAASSTKFWNSHGVGGVRYSKSMVFPVIISFSNRVAHLIQKLNAFSTLEPGWNSYNAEKISETSINAALSFLRENHQYALPFYFVAPGINGEVLLELKQENKAAEIYFNPDFSKELIMFVDNEVTFEGDLETHVDQLMHFFNE